MHIDAPRDDVFAFMADVENEMAWNPDVRSIHRRRASPERTLRQVRATSVGGARDRGYAAHDVISVGIVKTYEFTNSEGPRAANPGPNVVGTVVRRMSSGTVGADDSPGDGD